VKPATEGLAHFLGGFTAAEGTFGANESAGRFRFAVSLGATDQAMCKLMYAFLGVGHITFSPRRKPHYDDEVTYAVQALHELKDFVVPFMDEHLPESYKREQYLDWREKLLDYIEHRARRPRSRCTISECDQPARAHGLCRKHLWEFRRQ
jgi:hypothetical protein